MKEKKNLEKKFNDRDSKIRLYFLFFSLLYSDVILYI